MSEEDKKQQDDEAAKKAHEAEMDELFGDLDEDEEDFDDVVAQRDKLLAQFAAATSSLSESQKTNVKLQDMLTEQKEAHAKIVERNKKEAEGKSEFALEKFIKEIIPVVDTFERGLCCISEEDRKANQKLEKMAKGFENNLAHLSKVFNKFGIKQINPLGEEFDPEKHEAVSTTSDPDVKTDHVVTVAEKGYELKGRVIRTAKVIVNQ